MHFPPGQEIPNLWILLINPLRARTPVESMSLNSIMGDIKIKNDVRQDSGPEGASLYCRIVEDLVLARESFLLWGLGTHNIFGEVWVIKYCYNTEHTSSKAKTWGSQRRITKRSHSMELSMTFLWGADTESPRGQPWLGWVVLLACGHWLVRASAGVQDPTWGASALGWKMLKCFHSSCGKTTPCSCITSAPL